jgi:cell division protein FtsI/penicillin-binding protein 2
MAGGRRAITWRMVLLVGLLHIPLFAVAARLVQWQVLEHDRWLSEAQGNQRRLEPTRSPRGKILWSNGEIAAGELPVFGVQVIVADIAPDAWVYARGAERLQCGVGRFKQRLTKREPAAVEAVDAIRRREWLAVCRALVEAVNGRAPSPAPAPVTPEPPRSRHDNPFRRVRGAPAGTPEPDPAAEAPAAERYTLEALLYRAATLEADAVQRMNREWARIVGLGLRDENVPNALRAAREVAALADALHASWVLAGEEPVLLPYPSRERLAEMATLRRESIAPLLPAGTAARRRMEAQIRDADRVFARYLKRSLRRRPLLLIPEITGEALLAIEVRGGDPLPGVQIVGAGRRVYPGGPVGAHTIGFVGLPMRLKQRDGSVRDEYEQQEAAGIWWNSLSGVLDRDQYRQLERRGEFRDEPFGKSGLERTLEGLLRGSYGIRITDRDARNRLRKIHMSIPAERGQAVRMTLRYDAQAAAERILATGIAGLPPTVSWRETRHGEPVTIEKELHRGAAAVVMDVHTGAVIVAASVPGFDPNRLVPPVSSEAANELYNPHSPRSRYAPMLNRTIQGSYAPGSIMKIVSMAAALQHGVLAEGYTCTGSWQPSGGGRALGCSHANGCGRLTHARGLQKSCNAMFFEIGNQLDKGDRLQAAVRAFGFGARTGSGLAYESRGRLPRDINSVQLAVGQGRLLVTPMQVARMCAAIANGGRLVVPHLLADEPAPDAPQVAFLSPATVQRIHRGLIDVVNSPGGTAYRFRDIGGTGSLKNLKVAGKTGTAEKIKGVLNTIWFAGFAPYDDPQIAYAVVVEDVPDGYHAGKHAAPLAAQIVDAVLNPKQPAAARVEREGR